MYQKVPSGSFRLQEGRSCGKSKDDEKKRKEREDEGVDDDASKEMTTPAPNIEEQTKISDFFKKEFLSGLFLAVVGFLLLLLLFLVMFR